MQYLLHLFLLTGILCPTEIPVKFIPKKHFKCFVRKNALLCLAGNTAFNVELRAHLPTLNCKNWKTIIEFIFDLGNSSLKERGKKK